MSPVYDADALLLLSIELTARRRPAVLVDIVAACELLNGAIPAPAKLLDAFARLGQRGLLRLQDEGYVLAAAVQDVLTRLPRRAEVAERLFTARQLLATNTLDAAPAEPPLPPTAEALETALRAHATTARLVGKKNLLMPKPESQASATTGPGVRQRKPLFKAAGGKGPKAAGGGGNKGKGKAAGKAGGKPAGSSAATAKTARTLAPAAPATPAGNAPLRRRKG